MAEDIEKEAAETETEEKPRSRRAARPKGSVIILRVFLAICLLVFIVSGINLLKIQKEYKDDRDVYESAADDFVRPATTAAEQTTKAATTSQAVTDTADSTEESLPEETEESSSEESSAEETAKASKVKPMSEWETTPPIEVDFGRLQGINSDVVGWIYCSGTKINYPVLQGSDNSYYLTHTYDYQERKAGSIFVEAANSRGFTDTNTIVYGHHIKDGSMFFALKFWQEQSFYNKHPYMWLLTPEQNYRLDIMSAYVTDAESSAYKVYVGNGKIESYLKTAKSNSYIKTLPEIDKDAKYILLSTCAYDFKDARMLMHVKLTPVD